MTLMQSDNRKLPIALDAEEINGEAVQSIREKLVYADFLSMNHRNSRAQDASECHHALDITPIIRMNLANAGGQCKTIDAPAREIEVTSTHEKLAGQLRTTLQQICARPR